MTTDTREWKWFDEEAVVKAGCDPWSVEGGISILDKSN